MKSKFGCSHNSVGARGRTLNSWPRLLISHTWCACVSRGNYSDSNHGPKNNTIIITTHVYVLSLYYNLATFNIQHWFKSECSLVYSYFVSVPDDLPVPVPAPES